MKFCEVLEAMRLWVESKKTANSRNLTVEIVQNTDEAYRVIFGTAHSVSELMVNMPHYAPYYHVSFQVLSTEKSVDSALVYCYHDDATSSIDDIVSGLDEGIRIAMIG